MTQWVDTPNNNFELIQIYPEAQALFEYYQSQLRAVSFLNLQ